MSSRRKPMKSAIVRGPAGPPCPANTPLYDDDASAGRLFDKLDGELLLVLFKTLASLDHDGKAEACEGSAWHARRRATSRDCLHLAATCKWLKQTLFEMGNGGLGDELHWRQHCDAVPLARSVEYPYLEQHKRQELCLARVKSLRKCETAMAFHCAGKHCRAARRDAGAVLTPIESSSIVMMASAADAPIVFVAVVRDAKQYLRQYVLVDGAPTVRHELELVGGEGGGGGVYGTGPLYMAASPDGSAVAWIVEEGDSHSVCLWKPVEMEGCAYGICTTFAALDALELYTEPAHAQAVWWDEQQTLHVAFSTSFVSPTGHDEVHGAAVGRDEKYMLTSFAPGAQEAVGPFPGRLLTCSASADGERVVALVRRRPTQRWHTHYVAVAHHDGMAEELKHPSVWKCAGKRRAGKDGFDWGPSAAGISPTGDAIACMHRTSGAVVAEVLDLDAGAKYVSTNSRDVTQWFSHSDDVLSEDELSEDEENLPNKVKIPYSINFSDCGTFAAIVDRRPLHGGKAPNYSTVLLDISRRRTDRKMRACPLYRERQSLIKELEWRACGVWLGIRRGLLLLDPRPEKSV